MTDALFISILQRKQARSLGIVVFLSCPTRILVFTPFDGANNMRPAGVMPPTTKLIIDNLITVLGLTLLYTLPCMVVIFAIRAYKCLVIALVVNHGLLAGVALLLVTAISLPVIVGRIYKYVLHATRDWVCCDGCARRAAQARASRERGRAPSPAVKASEESESDEQQRGVGKWLLRLWMGSAFAKNRERWPLSSSIAQHQAVRAGHKQREDTILKPARLQ